MRAPLLIPSYQYQIKVGSSRRKDYLKVAEESSLELTSRPSRQIDKPIRNPIYYFQDLIKPELFEFCNEAQVTCSMTDAWAVRYQKGDQQTIHNHKSCFTGILTRV